MSLHNFVTASTAVKVVNSCDASQRVWSLVLVQLSVSHSWRAMSNVIAGGRAVQTNLAGRNGASSARICNVTQKMMVKNGIGICRPYLLVTMAYITVSD